MNYDVVSNGAKEMISGYLKNPEQFEQGFKAFYKEGTKNPSVARIIMHDEAIQNARECADIQKKLSREYDEFTPPEQVKPDDLKPDGPFGGIFTEIVAEAAAYSLNKVGNYVSEYTHKTNKYVKMLINHDRMTTPIEILDRPSLPEAIQKDKEAFDKEFDTLYPKTGQIRKNLIKYNIRKDKVTPRMPKEKRHYITMSDEELFSTDPNTGRLKLDIIEGKEPEKPSFMTTVKNLFKSKKRLNQEREAALEKRKEEYETDKLIRALSPL